MIVLTDLSKSYGKKAVLDSLSLTINPGEFVRIVGASGSGKTTLLKLLTGEERATSGRIEVDGVDVQSFPPPVLQLYRRRLGVIFEEHRLLPRRTVAENVAFPLEIAGLDDAAIRTRVTELLAHLHLSALADAFPADLSSGERALAAAARAVIHEPMILLADEPTGALDPQQAKNVLRLLRDLHQAGSTVILATHDLALAQSLSTSAHGRAMADRPGRMVELKNGRAAEVVPAGVLQTSAKPAPLSPALSAITAKLAAPLDSAPFDSTQGLRRGALSDDPEHSRGRGAERATEEGRRKIKVTMIHS